MCETPEAAAAMQGYVFYSFAAFSIASVARSTLIAIAGVGAYHFLVLLPVFGPGESPMEFFLLCPAVFIISAVAGHLTARMLGHCGTFELRPRWCIICEGQCVIRDNAATPGPAAVLYRLTAGVLTCCGSAAAGLVFDIAKMEFQALFPLPAFTCIAAVALVTIAAYMAWSFEFRSPGPWNDLRRAASPYRFGHAKLVVIGDDDWVNDTLALHVMFSVMVAIASDITTTVFRRVHLVGFWTVLGTVVFYAVLVISSMTVQGGSVFGLGRARRRARLLAPPPVPQAGAHIIREERR